MAAADGWTHAGPYCHCLSLPSVSPFPATAQPLERECSFVFLIDCHLAIITAMRRAAALLHSAPPPSSSAFGALAHFNELAQLLGNKHATNETW